MKSIFKKMGAVLLSIILLGSAVAQPMPSSALVSAEQCIGTIELFAYNRAPAGWVLCDGSAYSQSEFNDLYVRIGMLYGAAPGGMFKVPNLVSKAPVAGVNYYISTTGVERIEDVTGSMGEVCLFPDTVMRGDQWSWIKCSGQTLQVNQNAALYSLIGNRYGGTSTTFKVPNLNAVKPDANTSFYICTNGIMPSTGSAGDSGRMGSIQLVAYTMVPGDYFKASGQAINKNQYQALNALLQGKFGSTGTTFNLPSMTGFEPSVKLSYIICSQGLFPEF
jgi:microcystin-dependent protein